ncbi:MAG TPA: hypothetical protein VFW65_26070 [Pseudonocardiaceae bacterium]|nr:hypothetical protein [Pseudonocardiaceae bacterium]
MFGWLHHRRTTQNVTLRIVGKRRRDGFTCGSTDSADALLDKIVDLMGGWIRAIVTRSRIVAGDPDRCAPVRRSGAGEALTVDVAYRSLQRSLARRGLPEPKQKLTENASGILLGGAMTSPPPAPRPQAGPLLSEVRTVPAMAPIARPVPTPRIEPVKPAVLWGRIVWLLWTRLLWLLLFGVFVLAAGYGIGGFVGVVADSGRHFGAGISVAPSPPCRSVWFWRSGCASGATGSRCASCILASGAPCGPPGWSS